MIEKHFKRARQPEQKEQRRAAILSAARDLLEENGAGRVGLNAIARRTGLAKSNIYRYFESREHIFLALFSSEWAAWTEEIERELAGGGVDVDAVARLFTRELVAKPLLCELMSAAAPALEHNESRESAMELRNRWNAGLIRSANALHGAISRISLEECVWTVRMICSMVAGLWPTVNQREQQSRVAGRLEFESLQPNFPEDLENAVRALLYGLLVEVARATRR